MHGPPTIRKTDPRRLEAFDSCDNARDARWMRPAQHAQRLSPSCCTERRLPAAGSGFSRPFGNGLDDDVLDVEQDVDELPSGLEHAA